jgi:oligoribonuclease NrnB/cAMP/cGMP phosphodiesterase (DHH superfamily)
VQRYCFYHAGCPDGFGAAWAVRQAWGDEARYIPRRHENVIDVEDYRGAWVAYVDIAPGNEELLALARSAEQVTVLDHHVTAQRRYHGDSGLVNQVEELGHEILYDLTHSGAVLSWRYFHADAPEPDLLRYVEDQDLWSWQLPDSEEVNAAIAAYPRRFDVWDELVARPIAELADEGRSIVRANRMEVERMSQSAHPLLVDGKLLEAVNATQNRSAIGHVLAERKAYGEEWSCVYRINSAKVHATLYSIGDVDVGARATSYGGGGHKNAAGFTVSLDEWLARFVRPAH